MKSLKVPLFLLLSTVFFTAGFAYAQVPDHDDWYKNEYASLWAEEPWDNRKQIVSCYTKKFTEHPVDGFQTTYSNKQVLGEEMYTWRDEGWLSSTIAGYQSELLNATTAVFKVRWKDAYQGNVNEFVCGWYMADYDGEKWLFTQYADIDCAQHGLG